MFSDVCVDNNIITGHHRRCLHCNDCTLVLSDKQQLITQEALLSQRGRAILMIRVCIASIQNVQRSLLLLVVSASDVATRDVCTV